MSLLGDLVGESPSMVAVRERIERLLSRASDVRRLPPVLIQGETGTGKGLVARALHRAGPRAAGPFVDVNCAAIPETLLEAEMFGFERGAFTDARQAKRGLFQMAHLGTLFLDEIGLLPEGLQAKLLKVIEERVVRRLGSTQSEPVDVWILTATNADLGVAIRERRFREDLYHRLAVLTLVLPPLRERGDDVLLLAEHLLARACSDYGLDAKRFTPDARAALAAYPWPGNVRELVNVMERVVLLSEAPAVTAEVLGLPLAVPAGSPAATRREAHRPLVDAVEGIERTHLIEALGATEWNISRAASRLGISRNTLRYRIEKYGLRPGTTAPPARRSPRPAATPAVPEPAVPAAEPPAAAAVRWDRRRLTVLRAAVVARPEETGPLDSSRALEMFVDKVQSFGGRIEELSASGIVAVFGLGPIEHASWRAANAALAIQRASERVRGQGDLGQVSPRVGIHVASFMIGRVGETIQIDADSKREAWGPVEALAARADPGAILVSWTAAPLLERRFDLVPVEPVEGRSVEAYRLTRAERPQFEPGRRLAPFLGRELELASLRRLLGTAIGGQGQLVGLVGESGIGKSRLLFEFRQSLAGEPVTYLEAHCFEYGSAIPYLPVLDIIRQNCRIAETDSPEAIVQKVRSALAGLEVEVDECAPYLLHLLGIKEGTARLEGINPETVKARSFETLRRLTFHGSRRRPLVLAIEDLQWIDSMSEELIAAAADSLQGAPILLVATYRPGYRPSWMNSSYATQMSVGPLSLDDSLAVVRSVLRLPAVPGPLAGVILERAQGNPFFLEELARTLGDQGALGPVPDTVEEALLARLDRLPEGARRLVQTASVLGREVSLRVLKEMWEEPGGLDAPLRELTRQEILHQQVGAGDGVYVFRHALTQEVVYGSLLEPRRHRDHEAAGRALERLYQGRTEEIVEHLAHHFGRSGEAEKAVDYALLAAEKAQRRWANAEAVAHFESALGRLAAMPDTEPNRLRRIDAVVKQAEVKFALGQAAEHLQALEGIRPLVEAVADPRRRAAWYYWTGFLHSLTSGRPDVAIAHCQVAVAIADAAGFEDIRAFAESCLAQVYTVAGDLRRSVAAAERALAAFEVRGDAMWACRTLWHLSSATNGLGRWAESLDLCRRALEHGQAVNDLRLKVGGLLRTGWTHIRRGDHRASLRCCEEALALKPIPFDAAMVRAAHGCALIRGGDAAAGTAELEETLVWFERSHLRYIRAFLALWLAEGYLGQGERRRAVTVLEEVLGTSVELGYRYVEGVASRLMGQCLGPDDPVAAARYLEAAGQILQEIGAANDLALTWVALAELRRVGGDHEGARPLLELALASFETLGTLGEPARVRAALAELGDRAGS